MNKKISISTVLTVLKWVGFVIVALLVFFFGYQIYTWFSSKFGLTIPTKAAPGQTLQQTQQNYLAQQVPPPAANQSSAAQGVQDLITTDNLTWTDKLYLYLDTLNPWRAGGIFNSGN